MRNEEQQMEVCKEVIYLYENYTGWWFQPIWKILVKMGIFPK